MASAADDADRALQESKVENATMEFFELFKSSELYDQVEALIDDPRFPRVSDIGTAGNSMVERVALSVFAKHGLTRVDWKMVKMSKRFGSDYQVLCENGPVAQVKRKKEELLKLQAFREHSHDVPALLRKEEHLNWLIASHALREATQCLRYFVRIVATNLHKSIVDDMDSKNPAWKHNNKLSPATYDESLPEHKFWMEHILQYHTLDESTRRVAYSNCRANMLGESPLDMIKLFCSSVGHKTRDFERFDGTIIFNIITFCKEFHDISVCVEQVAQRQKLVEMLGSESLTDICNKCTTFRNHFAHDYTIDQEIPNAAFHDHLRSLSTICGYAIAVVESMPSKCSMFGEPKFKEEIMLGMKTAMSRLSELADKPSFRAKLTPQEYLDLREKSILEADAMRRLMENLKAENLLLMCKLDEKEREMRRQFLKMDRCKEKDLMTPPGLSSQKFNGAAGTVSTVYWNHFECAFKRYHPESVESWKKEIPTLLQFSTHPGVVSIHCIVVSETSNSDVFVPIGYLMQKMHTSLGSVTCAALTRSTILQLMIQAGNTLAHLHNQNCIHGDVKPENILVSKDFKTANLCDFGTASLRHPYSPVTAGKSSAVLKGTWFYIAPEHLEDYECMNELCDIYSFGMTLWQVFHPLVAKDKIGFEYHFVKLAKQIEKGFRPKFDEGLPAQLVSLIQMCWQTDPKERPQSMAEVLKVLKEIAFDADSETLLCFDDSSSTFSDDGSRDSPTQSRGSDVMAAASLAFESSLVNEPPPALTVEAPVTSSVTQRYPIKEPSSTNSPVKTSPKSHVSALCGSSASTYSEEFPEMPKSAAQALTGTTPKV